MKNIGVNVAPPKRSCNDLLCPFHGSLSIKGRLIKGRAVSTKAKGLLVVEKQYLHRVKKYMRYEKRRTRIHAHLPPCLDVREGDAVTIAGCRPLAKTVSFVVIERSES